MTINIRDQIVDWASKKLSKWQQDALRRIIEQETIADEDIEELFILCKKENDIETKTDSKIQPQLLKINNQKQGQNNDHPGVSLLAIKNVIDVNALAPNQNLTFNPKGLIVVYGDNGAGKTGYCRVIKAITRARGQKGEILRNYTSDTQSQQTAVVEYSVNGENKSFTWLSTCNLPQELAGVSFFDSSCANVYVERETDVAYRPYSLDILDRLVGITDAIKTKLQKEIYQLQQGTDAPTEDFYEGTGVYKLIDKLGQDCIKTEDIEKLCDLKQKELKRREFLSQNLSENDPIKIRQKIATTSNEVKKIEDLKNHIKHLREELGSEVVAESLSIKTTLETVSKAAQKLAKNTFSNTLPETGGGVWQALWESAKRYSQVVYKDKEFPVTEDKAKCLLCQRELDVEAKKKLQSFENFIKNDLSQRETQLKGRLASAIDNFESFQVSNQYYDSIIDGINDDKLKEEIKNLLNNINQLQKDVIDALKLNKALSKRDILPAFETKLSDYSKEFKAQIVSLEDILKKDRSKLENELKELEDRLTLCKKKNKLLELHKKLCLISKIQICEGKINTAPISKKNGELTQKLITEQLVNTFKEELNKLNLHTIQIELRQVKNEKGISYFKVLIRHPKGQMINVGRIASDGEHRSIALAGFLTELSTAEHKSAIVLDDPVSSLDHSRRTAIATRLVEEAKNRQVIVFTHDLYFLSLLDNYAETENVDANFWWLRSEAKGKGVVYQDKPWLAMPVSNRIKYLNNRVQLAQTKRKTSEDDYIIDVRDIYDLLRQSWERAIEEVLFNNVIARYRESIETKRLDRIIDISKNDCETVDKNMDKCSRFKHDQSITVNVPIPEPEEVKQDIQALEDWVTDLRNNRNRR